MKGKDCLIYPKEDMKKLMDFLYPKLDKETYTKMQVAGVLDIFSKIQSDVREED